MCLILFGGEGKWAKCFFLSLCCRQISSVKNTAIAELTEQAVYHSKGAWLLPPGANDNKDH